MTVPTPPQRRKAEAGFNLVEVIIATAILAGVLVSISTMFVLGGKSVKSGRELTKATTIANSAMEKVLSWPYDKIWGFTNGTTTTTTQTFSTLNANPAWGGAAADVADFTATENLWRSQAQAQLQDGYVTYQVDGVTGYPSSPGQGLTGFQSAQLLRVTVTVFWTEAGNRRRHVAFQSLAL